MPHCFAVVIIQLVHAQCFINMPTIKILMLTAMTRLMLLGIVKQKHLMATIAAWVTCLLHKAMILIIPRSDPLARVRATPTLSIAPWNSWIRETAKMIVLIPCCKYAEKWLAFLLAFICGIEPLIRLLLCPPTWTGLLITSASLSVWSSARAPIRMSESLVLTGFYMGRRTPNAPNAAARSLTTAMAIKPVELVLKTTAATHLRTIEGWAYCRSHAVSKQKSSSYITWSYIV